MEIEIGRGKKARRAYGFDDVAIVPSRRTRDPDDVDISWTLGPYRFELPLLASAMDGVVSPETAGVIGKLGGLAVLNLEGIWTRYEDADEMLERIASLPKDEATREMQEIYQEPVKEELIAQRIEEIKAHGVVAAASLTPQRVERYHGALPGRRARHPGHPGHGHLGRARLLAGPRAEPQGVRARAADPGRARRLRVLLHGAAPHAHRARPACSSASARARPAPRAACWASASRRRRRSPTWPPPAPSTCWRPATTAA